MTQVHSRCLSNTPFLASVRHLLSSSTIYTDIFGNGQLLNTAHEENKKRKRTWGLLKILIIMTASQSQGTLIHSAWTCIDTQATLQGQNQC